MKQNIKTGDTVTIIAGDNKGKSGKVVKMDLKNHQAMIEGIGVRERHLRATQFNPKGGKKDIHVGIDLSNLKKEGK
jgi:50S ribosomal protein L24